jgi:hypothetical protein
MKYMRCIGVFRATVNNFQMCVDVNRRSRTDEKVLTNIKPKVGSLASSQLTEARAFDLRKSHFTTTSDVTQALRRVRNGGCVPPKKKSAL